MYAAVVCCQVLCEGCALCVLPLCAARSCVKAGYFKDDFIQYFVKRGSRRSPLINRGEGGSRSSGGVLHQYCWEGGSRGVQPVHPAVALRYTAEGWVMCCSANLHAYFFVTGLYQ